MLPEDMAHGTNTRCLLGNTLAGQFIILSAHKESEDIMSLPDGQI